jgi:adenylate cyclase
MLFAATLAKLGKIEDANVSAQRLLELQPGYSITKMCDALDLHPSIAEPLSAALLSAGLTR